MSRPAMEQIAAAVETQGAKAVYDAAYRRMAGDRLALPAVGLPDAATIGEADYIGRVAFRALDPHERAQDLADVSIKLAGLPLKP